MDTPVGDAPAYWTGRRVAAAILLSAVLIGVGGWYGWSRMPEPYADASGTAVAGFAPAEPPFDLSNLTLDRGAIHSGGPRKDGIPSLTDPATVRVSDFTGLPDDARVIVVTVNGETRAYPVGVLNWHECVNDTLGGIPIAVTYCPLCDSFSVFDRRPPGQDEPLEFGVSGLLTNSNVLLYDRTHDALWSQVGLTAVSGPFAGESLRHLAGWEVMTLGAFRKEHPSSTVISLETGHNRDYTSNPYARYFTHDDLMFPAAVNADADVNLANKAVVIGVRTGDRAVAYPVSAVREASGELRDAWQNGIVHLRADEGGTVLVLAVPGDAQVVHTFWFAWVAFHPHTEVWSVGGNASVAGRSTDAR